MIEHSVNHATFVVDRTFDARPGRVFAAWAEPAAKARWFGSPDQATGHHELDFRVGGREIARGRYLDSEYTYDAVYHDIIPEERIVSTYEMYMDGVQISVSVATVEFRPEGAGTHLTYTEQGAFLDGDSPAARENGTRELLDALARELEGVHIPA